MLVIVEHRHVQGFAQLPFQVEAARRGDVLQAHAAEPGRDRADASYSSNWVHGQLRTIAPGMRVLTPRGLAGLGWGVSLAIGVKQIGASLGGGTSALQWVVGSYTLMFAALILTAGAFGDRFGA